MQELRNANHPKKGSSIKVDPIRCARAIKHIKAILRDSNLRDYCLFVLGINSAYRINELLSITIAQVEHLKPGDVLDLYQSKTGRYRTTTLNHAGYLAIQSWLAIYPDDNPDAPLFRSLKTGDALTGSTCCNMVKQWCADVGLRGNFGSHTLRKTWGYHQRVVHGEPTTLLTRAYGHAGEAETLRYLGIQPSEIKQLYLNEI